MNVEQEWLVEQRDVEKQTPRWPPSMPPDDIEMAFYEKFFLSKGFEPYPVQEEAFNRIFAGEHLMVMVPTGTGKTMIAKAGLMKALYSGQKAIYTTPLRALTEEKYRELCEDFGPDYVGFATGDYKINPAAPIQVMVAEILWNMIYGGRKRVPADIVIMDEGHYFNDSERGYVWEQSIIGLKPETQLVVLSATVGNPKQFCQWSLLVRDAPMELVESHDRKVPLYHRYEEKYLLEVIRELFSQGDYPAIVFSFSRRQCFEWARLLKSIRRFTTDEEQKIIEERAERVLVPRGLGKQLMSLLTHGIGIHHAGILPTYKQLVEELTLERLIKFVVSTETISAGINLPAKRVVFPELRKYIRRNARLLLPAEYHQMAGRAGRPQFDKEGIAITLAPEKVVQEFRKEMRSSGKGKYSSDPEQIRRRAYSRARTEAQQNGDVSWSPKEHEELVEGKPAALQSHTKITAGQILAIGLPDLTQETLPGEELVEAEMRAKQAREAEKEKLLKEAEGKGTTVKEAQRKAKSKEMDKKFKSGGSSFAAQLMALKIEPKEEPEPEPEEKVEESAETQSKEAEDKQDKTAKSPLPPPMFWRPASSRPAPRELNIGTVIDRLLLEENKKRDYHKQLVKITNNLRAFGVLNEQGVQVRGWMVGQLRGVDGLFVYYCMMTQDFNYDQAVEFVEFLVDHDVIQRRLDRKKDEKKRDWIRERLRERRYQGDMVSWDDIEAEYERKFPRPLTHIETIHQKFLSYVPHPELHGRKRPKEVWKIMESKRMSFMDFVERHDLTEEEGSLFSYLSRLIKTSKMLFEITGLPEFFRLEMRIRARLSVVDERIINSLWRTMKDPSLAQPLETLPPLEGDVEAADAENDGDEEVLAEGADASETVEDTTSAENTSNASNTENAPTEETSPATKQESHE
ncbi:MAG: DEAD/DEAH box helicase [Deltaproteobacteria bacterium]|nr:MAG: DEAD/DEAH box helicase [Deltaproteobacteria bacterium]